MIEEPDVQDLPHWEGHFPNSSEYARFEGSGCRTFTFRPARPSTATTVQLPSRRADFLPEIRMPSLHARRADAYESLVGIA